MLPRPGDSARLPEGPARGSLAPPGSKSLAIRGLIAAALTGGETAVGRLSDAEDVRAALALAAAVGAEVVRVAPSAVRVVGRPPGPHRGWRAGAPLELGESGTLARLATAAFAFTGPAGGERELRARGSLATRASPALFDALERAGVGLRWPRAAGARRGWPVHVRPVGPPSELVLERPGSSQEVSALALALAAFPGEGVVRVLGEVPSRPYLAMTLGVLARFGVQVESGRHGEHEELVVRGPLRAPEAPFVVEPDASAAAVALAAACLSDGEVEVPGIGADSLQGDVAIVRHLVAFGCDARVGSAALRARGRPRHGADVDLADAPDLAPVIVAVAADVAARLGGSSRIRGLATLQGKESPRRSVLADALRAVGLRVHEEEDALTIAPDVDRERATKLQREPGHELGLDARGDHRMAFAFALLGLTRPGVRVLDPGCVAKSWPGFWQDMARLFA